MDRQRDSYIPIKTLFVGGFVRHIFKFEFHNAKEINNDTYCHLQACNVHAFSLVYDLKLGNVRNYALPICLPNLRNRDVIFCYWLGTSLLSEVVMNMTYDLCKIFKNEKCTNM